MPAVYEFSAIAGLEIFDQIGGAPLNSGDTFTMPFSTVGISITDDDDQLSGGVGGVPSDTTLQTAEISAGGPPLSADIHFEQAFMISDQTGAIYFIAQLTSSTGDNFFTFLNSVPPVGATMSVITPIGIGDIEYHGLNAGLQWTPNADGSLTIEAEDMDLSAYDPEQNNNASGGQVVRVTGATQATASLVFGGESGTYNLELAYIDENDGQGTIEVLVNGAVIRTVVLDEDDDGDGDANSTISTVSIENLVLSQGDVIELRGTAEDKEAARIDALHFIPHGPPTAQDDAFSMGESGSVFQDVLANDSDANGDPLTIIEAGGNPANLPFTVTSVDGREANIFVGSTGALNFAADTDGNFEDLASGETDVFSVSYTISDGTGLTDTATVTVTVNGENDDPDAADDVFTMTEDELYIDNLLANDSDVDTSDLLQITGANGNPIDPLLGGATQFNIFSADGRQAEVVVTENFGFNVAVNPGEAFQDLAIGETDTITFSYDITDNNGGTDTADVTVTITGENDAPDANDDTFRVDQGVLLDGSLLSNDTDVDTSDTVTISSANGNVINPLIGATTFDVTSSGGRTGNMFVAAAGTLDMAFDQDGAFDDLGEGETDTVSFSYTITDGNGETDTATATITIDGVNDSPDANDDAFRVDQGELANGSLLSNDTDVDASDTLTISSANGNVINPLIGATTFDVTSSDGRIGNVFVAASGVLDMAFDQDGAFDDLGEGETDTVSFSYTITDGNGETDTATATITIDGVNDSPDANDDTFRVDQGELANGSLLSNDTDVDASDTLTISSANGNVINQLIGATTFDVTSSDGRIGNVFVAASGVLDMAFDQDGAFDDLGEGETDTVSFSYTITDGNGETDTAIATITIDGVNDGPDANDDTFRVDQGELANGSLLSNDTDVDASDTLTISSANSNVINPLIGATTFDVTSNDGRVGNVFVAASGVLDMAFDQDGAFDDLGEGETDTVSFSYTITDGNGETDTATATITIDGVNDGPDANDDTFRVDQGELANGSLLSNDTDVDALDTLTISSANGSVINPLIGVTTFDITSSDGRVGNVFVAASGTLDMAFDQDGAFDDLGAGETDTVTFSYTVTDGNGATDAATVTITVDGENDAPDANDDNYRVDEGELLGGSLLANDQDPDGSDTLSILSADGNAVSPITGATFEVTSADGRTGNLFVAASGALDMAFDQDGAFDDLLEGETDTVTFTYTITDGNGETDTATATITVDGQNAAPTANDDAYRVDEGALLGQSLMSNDTDDDTSDILSILDAGGYAVNPVTGISIFEVTSSAGRTGNVFIAASGALDMAFDQDGAFEDMAEGETDTVSFTYTITDGNGETDTATATITVDGQNDDPVANDDAFTVEEGALLGQSLMGNDGDVDAPDGLTIISADGNEVNPITGIAIFDVTSEGGRTGNVFIAGSGALDMAFDQDGGFDDLAESETDIISFDYTVSDGNGGTDTATATITVVGDGPSTVSTSFSASTPNTADAVSIELTTESTTDDGLLDGDIEVNFVSLPEGSVIAAEIIVFDDSDAFGTIVDTIEFDVPGSVDDPVNPDLIVNGSVATASFQASGLASDLGDANRAALVVQFDDDNDGIVDLPIFVEVDIFGSG